MDIIQLETPAAVVDLDRLEANIVRLQQYLDEHTIANRPHIKTHKVPEIARMQIEAGAVGITCQKLGEAEVMANADLHGLEGYGLILEYPEAHFYAASEEHGHVDFSRCPRKPEIGERVTVLPNHCCPVSNLFDQVVGVRQGRVEVVWPVAARGRAQ